MDLRHARLIAYDIEDDRTRQRIARLLEQYGVRIQKSVFLVNLTKSKLDHVCQQLGALCNGDEDVIDIIPVCGSCRARSVRIGPVPAPAIVVMGGEEEKENK